MTNTLLFDTEVYEMFERADEVMLIPDAETLLSSV